MLFHLTDPRPTSISRCRVSGKGSPSFGPEPRIYSKPDNQPGKRIQYPMVWPLGEQKADGNIQDFQSTAKKLHGAAVYI
jgi:hypothetical protein